nr:LytTR family DNA-binding domain-containing protein [uncultured Psychroserpens sp.]
MSQENIKALIVDDNYFCAKRIEKLLKKSLKVSKIDISNDIEDALEKITLLKPNIVFLDYELNDSNGFELLKRIPQNNKSIFIMTTGFDKYALEAFNYSIFDYLLKPFKDSRFFASLDRAINYIEIDKEESQINLNRMPIKQTGKVLFINSPDIKYIKSSGDYVEIHINKKKYVIRHSISNLYEELNKDHFYRIHRSTIINLNLIDEILFSDYGEIDVKIKNEVFRVSRTYKSGFLNTMKIK